MRSYFRFSFTFAFQGPPSVSPIERIPSYNRRYELRYLDKKTLRDQEPTIIFLYLTRILATDEPGIPAARTFLYILGVIFTIN